MLLENWQADLSVVSAGHVSPAIFRAAWQLLLSA